MRPGVLPGLTMRISMRQEVSVCLRAPRGTIQRVPARCRAESGIRPMRRAGWAGHDRALTVSGPVTSITRGPWVTASSPKRQTLDGFSPWGYLWLEGSPRRGGPGGEPRRGGLRRIGILALVPPRPAGGRSHALSGYGNLRPMGRTCETVRTRKGRAKRTGDARGGLPG